MKNFPVEIDGKEYWISRAVAVVGFVFYLDDGELFILAGKRGKGSSDFQGYWNVPCGYLDFDETTKQACSRELEEETNLHVNPDAWILFGIEDDPKANRQNITFRYYTFSNESYKDQTIYAKGAEKDEVEDVQWIPVSKINKYQWAFNHKRRISEIILDKLSNWINPEIRLQLTEDLN